MYWLEVFKLIWGIIKITIPFIFVFWGIFDYRRGNIEEAKFWVLLAIFYKLM